MTENNIISNEIELWQAWLDENNAIDIENKDISDISDLCDYVIVATVNNSRHMSHLSESAMTYAKSLKTSLLNADGLESREWVVLDFGMYMIHLFLPETREKYDLMDLWKEIKQDIKNS